MSIQVGARFLSYLFLFISTSVATLIISLLRVHVRVWRSGWHSCGTLAVWVRLCISKQFALLSRTTISYDVSTSTSSMIIYYYISPFHWQGFRPTLLTSYLILFVKPFNLTGLAHCILQCQLYYCTPHDHYIPPLLNLQESWKGMIFEWLSSTLSC